MQSYRGRVYKGVWNNSLYKIQEDIAIKIDKCTVDSRNNIISPFTNAPIMSRPVIGWKQNSRVYLCIYTIR